MYTFENYLELWPLTYGHRDTVTLCNCLYILLELYLLQGLYVPCPCGTLFIAGMGMGHIAPAINKVPHGHGTYSPYNK
jgi:hypothetical protein